RTYEGPQPVPPFPTGIEIAVAKELCKRSGQVNVSSEPSDECDDTQVTSFRPQARFEITRNYRYPGGLHTDRDFTRPDSEKKINQSEIQDDQINAEQQNPWVRRLLGLVPGGYLGIGCRFGRCRN